MALSNIAGADIEFRDKIHETEFLKNLLKAVETEQSSSSINIELIRNISSAVKTLTCASRGVYPSWTNIAASIPVISALLNFEDEEVLLQVAGALSKIVDNPDMVASELSCLVDQIDLVIKNTTNPKLKGLLGNVASKIRAT